MDLHILKGLEVRFSDLRILKGLADFRHITSGIIPFGYRLSRVFGGGEWRLIGGWPPEGGRYR